VPFYYRKDGKWIDVPHGDDDVQEFGEWFHDGRLFYQLLTHERYERLRDWLTTQDNKEARRLKEMIEKYEAIPTPTAQDADAAWSEAVVGEQ
jgi:hypothetical protein